MATVSIISSFGPSSPDPYPSGNLVIDTSGNILGTTSSGGINNDGSVFEVADTGSGYASAPTTVASFDNADGSDPVGGVIADLAGNLLGDTYGGGGNDDGTIFEIVNNAGTYASSPTILASFDGSDGIGPTTQLVMDSAGDLFGATDGGPSSATIFELAKTADGYASTPTTLTDFNSSYMTGPLVIDSAGDIFTAALSKSGPSTGSVIELVNNEGTYASTPTTLATFSSSDGTPSGALVTDAAGNLFGLTNGGGADGAGEIFEIAKTTDGYSNTVTVLASFTNPQANNHAGSLLIDGADNLFATTLPSEAEDSYLYELSKTDGIYADTLTQVTLLDQGGASALPGLTADSAGNLYGTTSGLYPQEESPPVPTVWEVTGSGFVPTTASTGETLGADNTAGQQLTGTPLNDTFYAGHNSVVMTGDGGADTFIFQYLPWNAGSITDFNTATDTLNLSGIFQSIGYTGSDPVGDGYLTFQSDGNGDTQVYVNSHSSSDPWPTLITTLDGVAPSSITPADYGYGANSGGGTGSGQGETLTANDTAGQQLTGTPYNDTFYAEQNSVIMTGDGGHDTFIFNALPWNAGSITDFNTATDTLDLSGIFNSIGYTGSDPVADGYLTFQSDGNGDTQVYVNSHSSSDPWPTLITTLDGVAPSSITPADYGYGSSSGGGGSGGGGQTVDDSQPNYTVPDGVTNVVLTGSAAQTVTANNEGDTITSNDYGSTLIGGTGNDTLIAGHGADQLTGNGGDDSFVFQYLPWNAGQITDFNPATDTLDLSGIMQSIGYSGSNPQADGYVNFVDDGQGDTKVYVNPQGPSTQIPILVTTLEHVSPAALHQSSDYVFT